MPWWRIVRKAVTQGMVTDLIFDFFGTLVGYTPGTFRDEPFSASHQVLLDNGFHVEYETYTREFTRVSDVLEQQARVTRAEYHMHDVGRAFFSACFDRPVSSTVLELFIDTFIAEWNRGTVFLPDISDFLERLSRRYRLSIISNTHDPLLIPRNLEAMGIAGRFAQIMTSVEFGVRKPDPRIFHAALDNLGISPETALYIGDSVDDDYHGATAAGLRCVLVDPDRRWHSLVTDRVDHLFDIESVLA
jgi:putative hydrolase of the HAD superfamily